MAASDSGQSKLATTTAIAEDDDLFELDIDLLRRRADDSHNLRPRRHCAADDGRGHALLANCLLPVGSVSNAVPVAAAGSVYPYYSGYYYGSRRLFVAGGSISSSSKRFLFGRSARFASRGLETMGNYFQRY